MRLSLCVFFSSLVGLAAPHGRLVVPPQRSSLWRLGFNSPTNTDDNGLNCGGFGVMFGQNDGRCGTCGDPWHAHPRQNEAGGRFANGYIVARYLQGQDVDITILITANHKGYFEFRLCPHNDPQTPVTQDCLDRFLLQVVEPNGGVSTAYNLDPGNGNYSMTVRLPTEVTCSQCVLQWKYRAGNNWGIDPNGVQCLGCGPQEHFINCADIAILPRDGQPQTQAPPATQRPTPRPTTQEPATQRPTPRPTTQEPITPRPATTLRPLPGQVDFNSCVASGAWTGQGPVTQWCRLNCAAGYCPDSHCECPGMPANPNRITCEAVGPWSGSSTMTKWCNNLCNMVGGLCPQTHCLCY